MTHFNTFNELSYFKAELKNEMNVDRHKLFKWEKFSVQNNSFIYKSSFFFFAFVNCKKKRKKKTKTTINEAEI